MLKHAELSYLPTEVATSRTPSGVKVRNFAPWAQLCCVPTVPLWSSACGALACGELSYSPTEVAPGGGSERRANVEARGQFIGVMRVGPAYRRLRK